MTKDEYDFIINNTSEIIQEIKIEFFQRYKDVLPVCMTMFHTKITWILFMIGYISDALIYHPDAVHEMNLDDDLRELCKVAIEHEDTDRYSELQLFLLTYQDIIY